MGSRAFKFAKTWNQSRPFEKQILPSERRRFSFADADNVSILIGADIPELHICYDVRQGSKNQPIALLTLLGWVLMGGIDSKATQINSNRISVNNKNLENSIENFWKIDSYGTTKDSNTSLLPRNEIKALAILEKNNNKNWWSLFVGTFMERRIS